MLQTAQNAFLNVDRSVTGRRWVGPDPEIERRGLAIAQATGLPEILGRILAARGVAAEEAAAYLEPTLRDLMPDPSVLRDMDKAAETLAAAVTGRRRVALFSDYDVDGAASAAIMIRWLRAQGIDPALHIPDRIDEGYGPNIPAMEALARRADLIICLDCGTLSHEPIAAAVAAGAEVMVIDHHLGGETLPPASAVVNPNRQDESGTLSQLCAAAMAFLLLVAANRVLRAKGGKAPDLMPLLEFAALATVADVAPLTGLNRAIVRTGLKVMARRGTPGLAALSDAARLTSPPAAFHLGFLLGPRINAGGRVGQADLGARLLSTDDAREAAEIAALLDGYNDERRRIEAEVLAAATAQAEERGADGPLVWAAGEGWHPGVVGIVASRLKEAFHRPAVVIGIDAAGEGKGSGRSVEGVDLGTDIAALAREGLLLKGGGHKMAAGLTVAAEKLEEAMAALSERLGKQGAGKGGPRDLRIDGAVGPGGATLDLVAQVDQAGPWGAAAPAPRFAIPAAHVVHTRRMGEAHIGVTLSDAARGGARLDAACFRAFEGPLGDFLQSRAGAPVHVAGRLEIDDWGGRRRARLRIEDAAAPA
ncbi:single-stranded-DNA-specific exonuclease RecJ [Rhodovulum sp. DZ06]|uniref:single-stranded-DNA-specific exonuclease RecJ n=1 Tax=Rhodovulum sp. DZ06 TaxID=3425126 RepID=UPI003D342AAE